MKKVVFTVTNDLSYDQRMNKICTSLAQNNFEVLLVGRERKSSIPLKKERYHQHRIKCYFEKGKLFYLEYNFKLFLFLLLRSHFDILCSIDLDTLVPGFFVSKIKSKPLVYDAHEYFTEMEEVVSRPLIQKVWKTVERWLVPKVDAAYTISDGYAKLFEQEYPIKFNIVRNATVLKKHVDDNQAVSYILYQGAVNVGRGLEELIDAMQYVDSSLVICGKGDVYEKLIEQTKRLQLEHKITFKGYVPPSELVNITRNAKIGITLFSNAGLSNLYSLCNRFFDYMHSGVPQLAMRYPEYVDFNQQFEVAYLLNKLNSKSIAEGLTELLNDKPLYDRLKNQALMAREKHNWQEEEKTLLKIYQSFF